MVMIAAGAGFLLGVAATVGAACIAAVCLWKRVRDDDSPADFKEPLS